SSGRVCRPRSLHSIRGANLIAVGTFSRCAGSPSAFDSPATDVSGRAGCRRLVQRAPRGTTELRNCLRRNRSALRSMCIDTMENFFVAACGVSVSQFMLAAELIARVHHEAVDFPL